MAVPPIVGLVHSGEPRAVQVRTPDNLNAFHSAVHTSIAVYTDTKTETDTILARWTEIMEAIDAKAKQILGK